MNTEPVTALTIHTDKPIVKKLNWFHKTNKWLYDNPECTLLPRFIIIGASLIPILNVAMWFVLSLEYVGKNKFPRIRKFFLGEEE